MLNIDLFAQLSLLTPITFYFLAYWASQKRDNDLHTLQKIVLLTAILGIAIIIPTLGVAMSGAQSSVELLIKSGLGLVIRIDALNALIYGMVSIIALAVLKFSGNYLSGDKKQYLFMARFLAVIASVQLMTIAGNTFMFFLCWSVTSIGLQKLLTVYSDRKRARRSVRIKFVIARLADLALFGSFAMLYKIYGSGDISYIIASIGGEQGTPGLGLALSLLALSAVLKSVQVPFHTWLFGVLESPTPVSALLHAGLLNAGPFLILRFSPLFVGDETASVILIVFGAISALYGSAVSTTQSRVKTALAYSSVGHMGFSLLLCGFGFFSASLLHVIAHSFYKAYSFLRSGSAVEEVQKTARTVLADRAPITRGFVGLALALFIFWGVEHLITTYIKVDNNTSFVGYVILVGISGLLSITLRTTNQVGVIIRTLGFALIVLVCYHLFEFGLGRGVRSVIPKTTMSSTQSILAVGVMCVLVLAQILQVAMVSSRKTNVLRNLRVHLRNGLYLDHLLTTKINIHKK